MGLTVIATGQPVVHFNYWNVYKICGSADRLLVAIAIVWCIAYTVELTVSATGQPVVHFNYWTVYKICGSAD